MNKIVVPTCWCVAAARQLSTVFPIQAKYVTEGSGTSAGSGPAFGYLIVRCGYCGTVLKSVDGFDFGAEKITILDEVDSISK